MRYTYYAVHHCARHLLWMRRFGDTATMITHARHPGLLVEIGPEGLAFWAHGSKQGIASSRADIPLLAARTAAYDTMFWRTRVRRRSARAAFAG